MNRLTLLASAVVMTASIACGSTSSDTTVGPSPARCGAAVTATPRSFTHAGGSGTLAVSAARECSWTAATQAAWITLGGQKDGQGDGTVSYTVAPNPSATPRSGTLTAGGQSAEVTQEPAPCTFELDRQSFDVSSAPSTGRVEVVAPAGCSWQASASVAWITILEGAQGSGTGSVRFQVAQNATPAPRTGTLTVAGRQVTVRQGAAGAPGPAPDPGDCTTAVDPSSAALGSQAGDGSFNVIANDTCAWSASSDAGWLTVTSGASGTGSGQVGYHASANSSASSRTGRITVNEAVFTVVQEGVTLASCEFEIEPTSRSIGAAGGTGEIEVDVDDGDACAWTAVSLVSWIQVTSGAAGIGDGEVRYRVDENTGAARSGGIRVAGLTFTVNQAAHVMTIEGEVSSLSGSCPNTTFNIGSQGVRTSGSTTFRSGSCSNHLRNGRRVRVTGPIGSGGVLDATEVRF